MLRIPLALFAAAALVVGAAPVAAETSERPKFRKCADIGPPGTDVGVYNITSRGIKCAQTRGVIKRWYFNPGEPDAGPAGWKCSVRMKGPIEIRHSCQRNGHSIGFSQYTA